MYFTIKIIRFFVRLFVKVVLLPITVGRLLVGAAGSSEDDYDFDLDGSVEDGSGGDSVDSSSTDVGRSGVAGQGETEAADSVGSTTVASAKARTNLERFRKSLYVLGAVHVLFAVGVVFVGFDDPYTNTGAMAAVVVLVGLVPVAIGAGLARRPTPAWHAGMGYVGLQVLFSFVTIPLGLLTLVIFGAVGYFGWTGRPALEGSSGTRGRRGTEPRTEPGSGRPAGSGAGASEDGSNRERTTDSGTSQSNTSETGTAPSIGSSESGTSVTAATKAETDAAEKPGAATRTQQEPETAADAAPETEAPTPVAAGRAEEPADSDDPSTHDERSEERTEQQKPADVTAEEAADVTAGEPIARYRDGLIDADPTAREAAIEDVADAASAGDVPADAAVDALAERLESDANTDVRAAACAALGQVGTDRARRLLADYRLDPDGDVSRAASRALRTIE